MHHVFVDEKQIINNSIVIDKDSDYENFKHLKLSLRININEKVLVSVIPFNFTFDYLTEVVDNNEKIVLNILEKQKAKELDKKVNLFIGIPKQDKLEVIIEKAVELGVYSITPVAMDYCVAKIYEKKSENKLFRLNNISKAASCQSKRNIIPEVKKSIPFNTMIDEMKNNKYNLLFYENSNGIIETKNCINEILNDDTNYDINVIIGPEGGFSDKEITLAKNNKIKILSLGDRILRTETAVFTALSIIMYSIEK